MGFGNGSQNEIGSIRNRIQHLEKDLAAQRAMNNELRTALHQSRFRRGMVLKHVLNILYNIVKTT